MTVEMMVVLTAVKMVVEMAVELVEMMVAPLGWMVAMTVYLLDS